jgi:PIN domain nuclease of toxin-antitoxin system
LGRHLSAYLDTQVAVWLAQSNLKRISGVARKQMERTDLLISPMALVEMEYLYEIRKIMLRAEEVRIKLEYELDAKLCSFSFSQIAAVAIHEKWTRDPFDRRIVAHAKANGLSPLISADTHIQDHYPRTVW